MKIRLIILLIILSACAAIPIFAQTQTGPPPSTTSSPISQPLIREGTLAVKLAGDFKLGDTDNEAEAEDLLGAAGIAPSNGWIADYPVTPDIAGELQSSVMRAADSGKLNIDSNEALQIFQNAVDSYNLPLTQDTSGRTIEDMSAADYPDSTALNDYYDSEGPPAVTYYAPPPDYAYLYDWVPYPFWWSDFWFPGFFVLVDFHIKVHWHHHDRDHDGFVSNHFRNPRTGHISRIDPANRYRGGTLATGGRTGWTSPAAQSRARAVFDRSRHRTGPGPTREFRGYGLTPGHEGVRSSAFEHSVNRQVEHSSSDRGFQSRSSAGQIPAARPREGGFSRGGAAGTPRTGAPSGGTPRMSAPAGGFHGGGRR